MKKRYKKKNQKLYWENRRLKNEMMRLFPREFGEKTLQNQIQLELLQEDMGNLRLRMYSNEDILRRHHRRIERMERKICRQLDGIKRWTLGAAALLAVWMIGIIFL